MLDLMASVIQGGAALLTLTMTTGAFVGLGMLDRRCGYHTTWGKLSEACLWISILPFGWLCWVLLPLITWSIVAAGLIGFVLMLMGGVGRVLRLP